MANNNAIYFSRELEFYLSVCDRMRGSYIHEKQSYVRFSTLNARVPHPSVYEAKGTLSNRGGRMGSPSD